MNNNLTIFSTEVIPVYTTETGEKVVLGRELHQKLGITTRYNDWFPRMVEYGKDKGFEEGESYYSFLSNRSDGRKGKPKQDHVISLRMAKHIATIQKSDLGYDIREKLFEIQEMVAENRQKEAPVDFRSILNSDSSLKLLAETVNALVEEKEKTKTLMLECSVKDEKIAVLEPKAKRCDLILQSDELLTVTKIAKEYGYSAIAFNKLLHQLGIQFWQSGQWMLYEQYQDYGYTAPYDYNYSHSNGATGTKQQTRWTQKGRQFLYDFLKERGIVPLIEREAHAE